MDFSLHEEHEHLRSMVREFAEKKIKPVAQKLDEEEAFSYELTKQMGELGLFGVYLPEQYGGAGMDYLSYIIAVEEIARIDGSQAATLAAHNSLGIGPIYNYGTEEQKMKYLPKLCTGEALWSFGLTEPEAGSDSRASKTTAKAEGDNWSINGSKIFITNGSVDINGQTMNQYNIEIVFSRDDAPVYKIVENAEKMLEITKEYTDLLFKLEDIGYKVLYQFLQTSQHLNFYNLTGKIQIKKPD